MIHKPIFLYEDNVGHLFLHEEGSNTIYQTDPDTTYLDGPNLEQKKKETFVHGCETIWNGDTQSWSEEWVHPYDEQMQRYLENQEVTLVAVRNPNNTTEMIHKAGYEARKYLELPEPE